MSVRDEGEVSDIVNKVYNAISRVYAASPAPPKEPIPDGDEWLDNYVRDRNMKRN